MQLDDFNVFHVFKLRFLGEGVVLNPKGTRSANIKHNLRKDHRLPYTVFGTHTEGENRVLHFLY